MNCNVVGAELAAPFDCEHVCTKCVRGSSWQIGHQRDDLCGAADLPIRAPFAKNFLPHRCTESVKSTVSMTVGKCDPSPPPRVAAGKDRLRRRQPERSCGRQRQIRAALLRALAARARNSGTRGDAPVSIPALRPKCIRQRPRTSPRAASAGPTRLTRPQSFWVSSARLPTNVSAQENCRRFVFGTAS